MKKKSLFKSKTQMIVYLILTIICLVLFVYIGEMDFHKNEADEQIKFSNLYNEVSKNNLYVFSNATDVLNIINGRSGVILFGFPLNKFVNTYASILNTVATENGIDKIYYYDFLKDRDESNGTYETIVKKLQVYAPVNDEGVQDIMAPTILIVKNGKVIAYIDDASIMKGDITPDIYYNENEKARIYEILKTALNEYKG